MRSGQTGFSRLNPEAQLDRLDKEQVRHMVTLQQCWCSAGSLVLPSVNEMNCSTHLPIVKEVNCSTHLPIVNEMNCSTHLAIVKEVNCSTHLPSLLPLLSVPHLCGCSTVTRDVATCTSLTPHPYF